MFSKIVVGTDGSDTANAAVRAAAELAKATGAELHLVSAHTVISGSMAVPLAGAAVGDGGLANALTQKASQEMLDEAAKGIEGVTVETHVSGGEPAKVLVTAAEEVGADLIVVGSKGMNRRILGSVPNSVAHNAPCDVLIVKTT